MTEQVDIHQAARSGYSNAADLYVKGRPDYPAEVNQWLRDDLAVGAGTKVLELGAGTGKFTRYIAETGADLIALEPLAAMRETMQKILPDIEIIAGQAEDIPLDEASQDVVICAQAFHWFANDRTMAEIARVLKPGGRLGLIWNRRDQRTDWVAALTDIMHPYVGDAPRHDHGDWKNVFPAPGFTPLVTKDIPHGHTGSAQSVIINRIMSVSFIASQPLDEQVKVEQAIRDLIDATPSLAGQSEVTFPYMTQTHMCQKA